MPERAPEGNATVNERAFGKEVSYPAARTVNRQQGKRPPLPLTLGSILQFFDFIANATIFFTQIGIFGKIAFQSQTERYMMPDPFWGLIFETKLFLKNAKMAVENAISPIKMVSCVSQRPRGTAWDSGTAES